MFFFVYICRVWSNVSNTIITFIRCTVLAHNILSSKERINIVYLTQQLKTGILFCGIYVD